jgi:beta-phosphoglucomutase-like phosphatase (HAD superfamily)
MNRIHAAIFDLDGLLIDTQRIYQSALEDTGKAYDISLTRSLTDTFAGASPDHIANIVSSRFSIDGIAFMKDVMNAAIDKEANDLVLKPGVKEILSYFESISIPMAVASGSPCSLIERNLQLVDIATYFSVIVSTQEVEHGKPAADVFLEAAHRLQVEPKHCLVFEDAINGVKAGIRGGFPTIMIPDIVQPDAVLKESTFGVFDTLDQAMVKIKSMMG